MLVASDAIGMGVNLNVRRIIFHALRTFDPENGGLISLDPSHIKQIAGMHPNPRAFSFTGPFCWDQTQADNYSAPFCRCHCWAR